MLDEETVEKIAYAFAVSFKGAHRQAHQSNVASVYATAKIMAKVLGLPLDTFSSEEDLVVKDRDDYETY